MAEFEYAIKKLAGDMLDSGDSQEVAEATYETDREHTLARRR